VALACQQPLAGFGARCWGWHLVVDGQLAIASYPSEHPVGVPV